MTTPLWTEDYEVNEGNGIVTKFDGTLHEGYVKTLYGIVIVDSRAYISESHTRLEFICNRRLWVRVFDRQFQPRYLVALCKRFAADIAMEKEG